MALSLNDLDSSKQKPKRGKVPPSESLKETASKAPENQTRQRPWHSSQTPEPPTARKDSTKHRVDPFSSLYEKAHQANELISELATTVFPETWLGKIQLRPKVRIPIPKFLSTREKK